MEIKEGYIRVSSILAQWNLFAGIPPSVLERKAKIGTEVHEIIAARAQDVHIGCSLEALQYVRSWEAWRAVSKAIFEECETRLYCQRLHITGCIDALACLGRDPRPLIIDYKTSSGPSPTWALQMAFYYYLAKINGKELQDRALVVLLNPDGTLPKVIEYKMTNALWAVCEAALQTYRFLRG